MKRQKNFSQMKKKKEKRNRRGWGERKPTKKEISNFTDKDLKEMVMGMVTKIESGIEKLRKNFDRELESIRIK